MDVDLDKYRAAWKRAATFSIDKEKIYPELKIVQEFDSIHDREVLEYGCGAGSDALSYLRRGNTVVLSDITPDNIIVARENVERAGFFREAEFVLLKESYPLPFPDDIFDLVNSNGVIHHIPEGEQVVKEFHRVLRPGGFGYVMLYTEFLWDRFSDKMKELVGERTHLDTKIDEFEAFCWCTDGPGTPYARKYTEDEGREMFERCGFTVEKMTLYNHKDFREYRIRKSR